MNADVALQSIVLALITGLGPVLAIVLTGRQRRRETVETWQRQDEVARLQKQEAAAQRASQQEIISESHRTGETVEVVHGLVNDTLTRTKQQTLIHARGERATVLVNIELLRELGRNEAADTLAEQLARMDHDIAAAEQELADRAVQAENVAPVIESLKAGR
jgi:hypothetical protein